MPQLRSKNIATQHRVFAQCIEDWPRLRKKNLDLYVWRWGHTHQNQLGEYTEVQQRLMDVGFCHARLTYMPESIFLTIEELANQLHIGSTPKLQSWLRFIQSRRHLIEYAETPSNTLLQVLLEGHPQSKSAVHKIQRENELEIWAMSPQTGVVDNEKVCPLILNAGRLIDIRWINPDILLMLTNDSIQLLSSTTGQPLQQWVQPDCKPLHPEHPFEIEDDHLNLSFEQEEPLTLKLTDGLKGMTSVPSLTAPLVQSSRSDVPQDAQLPTSDKNILSSSGFSQIYNGSVYQFGEFFFSTDTDGSIRFVDSKTGESQVLLLGSMETDVVGAYNNILVFTVATQSGSLYFIDVVELFKLDTTVKGWTITNGVLQALDKSVGTIAEGLLIPNRNTVIVVNWNGIFGTTEQFELTCYKLDEQQQFKMLNMATGYGWNPFTAFAVYSEDRISVTEELGHELLWYSIERDDEMFKAGMYQNIGRPIFEHFFDEYDEINIRAYETDASHEIEDYSEGELIVSNSNTDTEFQWVTDRDVTLASLLTETSIVVVLDEVPKLLTLHRPF